MDSPSWALQEAVRQVTALEVFSRSELLSDLDRAVVMNDLELRRDLDPVALYIEMCETQFLLDAVLDDDETNAARDAARDMARDHADVAQSAARLQRNTMSEIVTAQTENEDLGDPGNYLAGAVPLLLAADPPWGSDAWFACHGSLASYRFAKHTEEAVAAGVGRQRWPRSSGPHSTRKITTPRSIFRRPAR